MNDKPKRKRVGPMRPPYTRLRTLGKTATKTPNATNPNPTLLSNQADPRTTTFSMTTKPVRASMVGTLIAPTASITSIYAQQHPAQNAP